MPADSAPTSEPSDSDTLGNLFKNSRTNAIISWLLVGVLGLVFIESLLDFDRLWILFVSITGGIVMLPAVAYRDWHVMVPWELLTLALLPILVRALAGGELGTFGYYLSVAGLALIVAVELHMFTTVKMNSWFAVFFVVLTTLASVAAWSIIRWNSDRLLGTEFLLQEGVSQDAANAALMIEFMWVALAGLVAGVLFDAYFRQRGKQLAGRLRRVVGR